MLSSRRALVLGVANQHSIAWSVVQGLVREGAFVVVGTQNERLRDRVARMADEKGISGSIETLICDVCCDDNVGSLAEAAGELDTVVHSVAFASPAAMKGSVLNVTREDFRDAHAVSAYSFVCLARHTLPRLRPNASLMCMSYLGAHRASSEYSVMGPAKASLEACVRALAVDLGPRGHRVNCISAGPVNTAAARGIRNFRDMLERHRDASPLQRNVSVEEVARVAAFLASDLSSGVTGQTLYVDAGFNVPL